MERGESKARKTVIERSGGLCEVCMGKGTEYSHRIPRRINLWRWHPANGLWLCSTCHRMAHQRPIRAYAMGVHIKTSFSSPVSVPFLTILGMKSIGEDGQYE